MSNVTSTSDAAISSARLPLPAAKVGAGRLYRGRSGGRCQLFARPQAGPVVATADLRRKPGAVHPHHAGLGTLGVVERGVAQGRARAVRQGGDDVAKFRHGGDRLAVHAGNHGAARHARRVQHVARVGDVHAAHGRVEVSRHLVRKRVHHGIAELEELRGRDRVQVAYGQRLLDLFAAALDDDVDLAADGVVENFLERQERGHELAVDVGEDVARLQLAFGRRARQHFVHHQHAGEVGARLACGFLRDGPQAETHEFVVRRVVEDGLQGAARHGLAALDQLQRALHAIERQVETGLCPAAAAGVQRDDATLDVDHRRTRRAPRRAGGGLHVERIEVVVLADAVLGGRAVEPSQRARQDRELFAGVIADDADLGADARALRIQRQRHGLHVPQPGRVVAIDAEVVHRVAIDGVQLDFLAVLEHRGCHHRSGRHHVPVGQDQAAHGVDHEARRLARLVPLRVEGAGLVDFDGDDRRRDALDRAVPGGAFGGGAPPMKPAASHGNSSH